MTDNARPVDGAPTSAELQAQVEQYRRRVTQLEAIGWIWEAAGSSLVLAEVLDEALDTTLAVTAMEAGEVWLLDAAEGGLRLAGHRGSDPAVFWERCRFAVGEGIPGLVVQTGEPVIIADLAEEPRFLRRGVVEAGFQTFVALPLKAKGEIAGCLNVAERRIRTMTPDDVEFLSAIGAVVGRAVANANLYEQLKGATRQLQDTIRQLEARLEELERVQSQLAAPERMPAADERPPEPPATSSSSI